MEDMLVPAVEVIRERSRIVVKIAIENTPATKAAAIADFRKSLSV
jgi:hypothetical protein